jgi:hypothetical protein
MARSDTPIRRSQPAETAHPSQASSPPPPHSRRR